jgi:hypothetical protein
MEGWRQWRLGGKNLVQWNKLLELKREINKLLAEKEQRLKQKLY